MNRQTHTMGVTRSILVGLVAVAVAGVGSVGFAGAAGAARAGGGGGVSCAKALKLNSTYGYTYLKATGEVVGLSGKGCSTSNHKVTITFEPVYGPGSTGPGDYLRDTVKPSCPVSAPHDCTFSFSTSWPAYLNGLYLTAADAERAYGTGAIQEQIKFAAKATTGAWSTLTFYLWTGSGE